MIDPVIPADRRGGKQLQAPPQSISVLSPSPCFPYISIIIAHEELFLPEDEFLFTIETSYKDPRTFNRTCQSVIFLSFSLTFYREPSLGVRSWSGSGIIVEISTLSTSPHNPSQRKTKSILAHRHRLTQLQSLAGGRISKILLLVPSKTVLIDKI